MKWWSYDIKRNILLAFHAGVLVAGLLVCIYTLPHRRLEAHQIRKKTRRNAGFFCSVNGQNLNEFPPAIPNPARRQNAPFLSHCSAWNRFKTRIIYPVFCGPAFTADHSRPNPALFAGFFDRWKWSQIRRFSALFTHVFF